MGELEYPYRDLDAPDLESEKELGNEIKEMLQVTLSSKTPPRHPYPHPYPDPNPDPFP